MEFKTAYGVKPRKEKFTVGPSLVKQAFKKECDINNIMARYQKTGLVDHVAMHQGNYDDLSDVPSYHEAMNKVLAANVSFRLLPSSIRKRFNNDPALFLDFVSDESNRDEMVSMGLIPQAQELEPKAPVVEPEPAGGES